MPGTLPFPLALPPPPPPPLQVLAQDRPASLPMTLLLSAVLSPGQRQQQQQGAEQQQQQQPRAAPQQQEYVTVHLSDGWYSIKAVLDAGLSRLVHSGRLQVGRATRLSGSCCTPQSVHTAVAWHRPRGHLRDH